MLRHSAVPSFPYVGQSPSLRKRFTLQGPFKDTRVTAFFQFRQDGKTAGGSSQKRGDFDRDDVEQYFNYMGCLAVEGTYDRMYALLSKLAPIDVLLLFAAAEADLPKLEELCEAGADVSVTDLAGQTPAALAGRNNVAKQADAVALLRKYAQAS